MGVLKLSSRTACFLLWLFVVHSVQVSVLAVPAITSKKGGEEAARKPAVASDGSEVNISILDRSDAHNSAPPDVAHTQGSTELVENGEKDKLKILSPQLAPTAESKTKEESNVVQSPGNIQAQDNSNQDHRNRMESVEDKRGGDNLGQSLQKPRILPVKQLVPVPGSSQAGEQQENGVGRPASSGSDKLTADAAVDAGKQNASVNNARKHPETEKTSGKKQFKGSAATESVSHAVSTSEATTLAQEKTLATTTLKPAVAAYPATSEHAKLLPSAPSQGQGVEKKYSDALPDITKDLGGIPSASSGNIEYGPMKDPDSGEDLGTPPPTQKNPTFAVSTSAQLGAQPVMGSVGGTRPEKPLDASAAAGSIPLLPAQDDSHFFAYFLTAVVLCVVGYLAFHNKRKILALILEGRHERQRRHNGHYRRLDNADDASAVRKGRGSF